MKKLTMGWHGDYYWSGLVWHTREKRVKGVKCVGSGKTPDEAQADLDKQLLHARIPKR